MLSRKKREDQKKKIQLKNLVHQGGSSSIQKRGSTLFALFFLFSLSKMMIHSFSFSPSRICSLSSVPSQHHSFLFLNSRLLCQFAPLLFLTSTTSALTRFPSQTLLAQFQTSSVIIGYFIFVFFFLPSFDFGSENFQFLHRFPGYPIEKG